LKRRRQFLFFLITVTPALLFVFDFQSHCAQTGFMQPPVTKLCAGRLIDGGRGRLRGGGSGAPLTKVVAV